MALSRYYMDDGENFGPLKNMDRKPYWRVKSVSVDSGTGWRRAVDDEVSLAHVMVRDKGAILSPGFKYQFMIEIFPPSIISDVETSGPVFDVVGRSGINRHVFVLNNELRYNSFCERHCEKLLVTTNMITGSDDPVFVRPRFKVYLHRDDPDLLTLHERLRLLEHDVELVTPTGKMFPVHSQVLRANSCYFSTMLDYAGSSAALSVNADGRKIMLDDEFSDEVWELAVEYMYRTNISCNDIEDLQNLLVLGDKYLVKDLVISAARRLQDFVGDRMYDKALPYVVSIMMMAVYYHTKLDDRGKAEMQVLLRYSRDLVHANCHELWTHESFVTAYSEFVVFEREMLGVDAEVQDKPMMKMLGKRKWGL